MKQLTLATAGFERYAKTTRRAAFLDEMERVVPWSALCALLEPFYPKPGNGRPPIGVGRMLRLYFLQQWFNLSDPAAEEALYDTLAMHRFVGIDLGREPVPDETTMCRFRHLLEEHDLGQRLFAKVQRHLAEKGLKVATGTIVDATIISAPSSTKNAGKARDPEMHQTKKGNQWYFGMKGHFGVDSRLKLIHSVAATPANVADGTVLPELPHGKETRVWGDQAYRGQRAGSGAVGRGRATLSTAAAANAVRLQLHALAYNLGNFMRTLAMPKTAEPWSLTCLCEKLVKIGAKVVSHGRYVIFQMAEVAVSQQSFADILLLITRLRAPPVPHELRADRAAGGYRRGLCRRTQITAMRRFGALDRQL